MGHPEIDNQTPFAFEPLFVADEEGRPIIAPIVKATFDVSSDGAVTLATTQQAVNFTGEHHGKPEESSYRLEPETAFVKPSTDVVLLGHAVAPRSGTTGMLVHFRVGPVEQIARVSGDRHFESTFFGTRISPPTAFERIPLIYERAFGGWDRSPEKPDQHGCEPRNPVGLGFCVKRGKRAVEEIALPNIEDPRQALTRPGGGSPPVGFGFLCPDWQPRAALAGTYEDAWAQDRSPLLPLDFDRRFFNAAAPALVAPAWLAGDETVLVQGATARPQWSFALPGIDAPRCRIATRAGDHQLVTNLDTVIVDADASTLTLLWRTYTALRSGPLDVRALQVTCANAPSPTTSSLR